MSRTGKIPRQDTMSSAEGMKIVSFVKLICPSTFPIS